MLKRCWMYEQRNEQVRALLSSWGVISRRERAPYCLMAWKTWGWEEGWWWRIRGSRSNGQEAAVIGQMRRHQLSSGQWEWGSKGWKRKTQLQDIASDWQWGQREGMRQSLTEVWILGGWESDNAIGKMGSLMEEQGALQTPLHLILTTRGKLTPWLLSSASLILAHTLSAWATLLFLKRARPAPTLGPLHWDILHQIPAQPPPHQLHIFAQMSPLQWGLLKTATHTCPSFPPESPMSLTLLSLSFLLFIVLITF